MDPAQLFHIINDPELRENQMTIKLDNKVPNYSAKVIQITELNTYENLSNLVGIEFEGMTALVSKDNKIGDIGIIFPTECQLSHELCYNNNLYTKKEHNKNGVKGYIENSRRVKAIKLRGVPSNCLFLPITCLSYMGINPSNLKIGDSFTHINDVQICKKYYIRENRPVRAKNKIRGQIRKAIRITDATFPKHYDTDNFFKNTQHYHPNDWIVVTQKLHGTSARFTNGKVLKLNSLQLSSVKFHNYIVSRYENKKVFPLLFTIVKWYTKFTNFLSGKNKYEYDYVAGSRKVIKDLEPSDHFYGVDLWGENLAILKENQSIPKDYIIYGEIIGWASNGKPIQPDFTYNLEENKNSFYVYRISHINEDGYTVDLTWNQIKEFCDHFKLNHVPELWKGHVKDFDVKSFLNIRYSETMPQAISLCPASVCDEGVCIRRDNSLIPYVTKAKSPEFLGYETKLLDSGTVDIETLESLEDEDEDENNDQSLS